MWSEVGLKMDKKIRAKIVSNDTVLVSGSEPSGVGECNRQGDGSEQPPVLGGVV